MTLAEAHIIVNEHTKYLIEKWSWALNIEIDNTPIAILIESQESAPVLPEYASEQLRIKEAREIVNNSVSKQ